MMDIIGAIQTIFTLFASCYILYTGLQVPRKLKQLNQKMDTILDAVGIVFEMIGKGK